MTSSASPNWMAYDPQIHLPLIEGGVSAGAYQHELWAWNGTNWYQAGGNLELHWTGVTGNADSALAASAVNGLILAGGIYSDGSRVNETFKVDYADVGQMGSYTTLNKKLSD